MTNEEILKAFGAGDLSGTVNGTIQGGLLNDEQANKFIRKLIEQPTLLKQIRVVEMGGPTRQINKIGFGKRILRAGTEGTALTGAAVGGAFDPAAEATLRAKPTTEKITLTTKEVIAEVVLTYDVIEDNIERGNSSAGGPTGPSGPNAGGIMNTILDLMAERVALDLEEAALLADTTVGTYDPGALTPDPYLFQWDGFLSPNRTGVNVYAAAGVNGGVIGPDQFKGILKLMPDAYLRNRPAMRNFLSVDEEINYRSFLAARATGLGDATVSGNNAVFAFGTPLEVVSLMPNDQMLFCDPLNLLMGIQRRVTVEYDKNISSRTFNFVVTTRVDFEIEEEAAVVKTTGLTV